MRDEVPGMGSAKTDEMLGGTLKSSVKHARSYSLGRQDRQRWDGRYKVVAQQ